MTKVFRICVLGALIFFQTGCITDRRIQPVTQESLEKDPKTRPSYFENQLTGGQQPTKTTVIQKGFSSKEIDCKKGELGTDSVSVPVYSSCKYNNQVNVNLRCKKEITGTQSPSYPARFKKITFTIEYVLEDGDHGNIEKSSTSDHEGKWSESFTTKSKVTSILILSSHNKNVLSNPEETSILLSQDECSGK